MRLDGQCRKARPAVGPVIRTPAASCSGQPDRQLGDLLVHTAVSVLGLPTELHGFFIWLTCRLAAISSGDSATVGSGSGSGSGLQQRPLLVVL